MSKKYTAISNLLNYDETDIKEEGHYMQPEELDAIETSLTDGAAAAATLQTVQTEVTQLREEVATLTTAADTDKQTITNLNSQIDQLNSKVAELGGQASGTGTTVTTTKDEKPAAADENITLNHPDHPVNVEARREIAARKAAKEAKKYK